MFRNEYSFFWIHMFRQFKWVHSHRQINMQANIYSKCFNLPKHKSQVDAIGAIGEVKLGMQSEFSDGQQSSYLENSIGTNTGVFWMSVS